MKTSKIFLRSGSIAISEVSAICNESWDIYIHMTVQPLNQNPLKLALPPDLVICNNDDPDSRAEWDKIMTALDVFKTMHGSRANPPYRWQPKQQFCRVDIEQLILD